MSDFDLWLLGVTDPQEGRRGAECGGAVVTWEDYDQVPGWPARATPVTQTPASVPWRGRCYACKQLVYDDEERCPFCRHFPEAVARRALKGSVAA